MTQQFDMLPADLVEASVLERIEAQLPKPREVKAPRLRDVMSPRAIQDLQERILEEGRRLDVGHELVLPERAREDHR